MVDEGWQFWRQHLKEFFCLLDTFVDGSTREYFIYFLFVKFCLVEMNNV